jgi:phage baseplate assembly protein gpV
MPLTLARAALESGQLVRKQVEDESEKITRLSLAWRSRDTGRALKWWLARLEEPAVKQALLALQRGEAARGVRSSQESQPTETQGDP